MAILDKFLENRIKDIVMDKNKAEFDRDYYRNLCEEVSESNNNLKNKVSELEQRIDTMQKYTDANFLDNLALDTAKQINDIFVRSWNGVGQRTANVQCLLRDMLQCGLTGTVNRK